MADYRIRGDYATYITRRMKAAVEHLKERESWPRYKRFAHWLLISWFCEDCRLIAKWR